MSLTHIDLFSGIGGFALAAQWAGFETKVFCEIDPFCQKVLKKHWPNVPIVEDIKKFDGKEYAGATLLTGGFPCQPFSQAGEQRGKADDRYLWPEMLRIISEARPTWVLGENVTGIISMGIEESLSDLEAIGYQTQLFDIPACAIDAIHERRRIWIVAYTTGFRCSMLDNGIHENKKQASRNQAYSPVWRCEGNVFISSIGHSYGRLPNLHRMDDGLSNRVDRLRALGNAIVPQVAYQIIKAIVEVGA